MASDQISREALVEYLSRDFGYHFPLYDGSRLGTTQLLVTREDVISAILHNIPAVDAEPVRRGRWMLESAGWKRVTFDGYMHCPNCNEAFRRIVGTKLFKRCPECGCVMDGGKQDDNNI